LTSLFSTVTIKIKAALIMSTIIIFIIWRKVKGKVVPEGVEASGGIAPPFVTSAPDGGEWSASCPGERAPPYPLDMRLGGPTLWSRVKSCPCQESNPNCPACSSPLYRLSYLDSYGERPEIYGLFNDDASISDYMV
jgi:hypothetical protein